MRKVLMIMLAMIVMLAICSTEAAAAYSDVDRVWMEPDYTLCWESEPGKVYQIFWSGYIPSGFPIFWSKASSDVIAEDTVTTWKDEGDPTRPDPSDNSIPFRYYKVRERTDIYYVAQNHPAASDGNPGTEALPFKTIRKATYVATAGNVVLVKKGAYREEMEPYNGGTGPNDMVTYAAYPGDEVIIKGSDVFTNWTHVSGSIYKNEDYVATVHPSAGSDPTDYWDLVFVDDQERLERVYNLGDMAPGTVFVDIDTTSPYTDDILYVWLSDSSNPSSHVMEAAVRRFAFRPSVKNVNYIRIKGFKMRHFSWGAQWGAVMVHHDKDIGESRGWVIEDNEISWTTGSGVVVRGWDHTIRGNKLNDCGNCGGQSMINDEENPAPQRLLVENNEFKRNNWMGYPVWWASGGWKSGWCSYSTFRNNVFEDNDGPGIWIDWGNYEVDIYNNYFDNNMFHSIRLEVAQHINVWNNIVMNTRPEPATGHQAAMYVMGDHNQIAHNIFYNNNSGIYMWDAGWPPDDRTPYDYYATADNEIHNNIFYQNTEAFNFLNASPDSNTIDYNLYDRVGGFKKVYIGAGHVASGRFEYGYTGENAHTGDLGYLFEHESDRYFYLKTIDPLGITSAPYKVECWFYVPSGEEVTALFCGGERNLDISSGATGPVTVKVSGYSTTVSHDTWHKFELYRVNETTLEARINDVLLQTFSVTPGMYTTMFKLGDSVDGVGGRGKFYVDDIKIYNGPTVYFEDTCEDAGGSHSVFDTPGFVDFSGGDYHLQPGSAARDAGTFIDYAPIDLDGIVRSDPPDIGPYEY